MRLLLNCIFLGASSLSAACRHDLASADQCRSTRSASAQQLVADTSWRARLIAMTETAPADSQVAATFFFASSVLDEDRTFVESAGGRIIYVFRGLPAANVMISAADLRAIAASGTYDRLVTIQLGLGSIRQDCR